MKTNKKTNRKVIVQNSNKLPPCRSWTWRAAAGVWKPLLGGREDNHHTQTLEKIPIPFYTLSYSFPPFGRPLLSLSREIFCSLFNTHIQGTHADCKKRPRPFWTYPTGRSSSVSTYVKRKRVKNTKGDHSLKTFSNWESHGGTLNQKARQLKGI